ncbi:MAG: GNAT family N-acetyltransferase [Chloroflexota bacterium]
MTISSTRLAETEYIYFVNPDYTIETKFGLFQNHPEHRHRFDAHQLAKCHCLPGQADELLMMLTRMYESTLLNYRYIMGHDLDTFDYLAPILQAQGWQTGLIWMFTFDEEPQREANSRIEIHTFDALNRKEIDLPNVYQYVKGRHKEDLRFYCSNDYRVGGEWVIAYLDGKPVSSTGWYIHDGLARFRPVATIPSAEGKGAATTLIRHIQSHPIVQAQERLVLLCREDGPTSFYEQLGFVKQAPMWEALLQI